MKNKGFTLIELLIVIAIVAILAGAMVPMFRVNQLTAQQAKAAADMDSIKTAAMMYNQDTGLWPVAGTISPADDRGLVTDPPVGNWAGPYMDEARMDPWGTAVTPRWYTIVDTGAVNDEVVTLWCYGADGVAGGVGANADISLIITPDRDPNLP